MAAGGKCGTATYFGFGDCRDIYLQGGQSWTGGCEAVERTARTLLPVDQRVMGTERGPSSSERVSGGHLTEIGGPVGRPDLSGRRSGDVRERLGDGGGLAPMGITASRGGRDRQARPRPRIRCRVRAARRALTWGSVPVTVRRDGPGA